MEGRHMPHEFRADQACAYSGATPRQIRYWDQIGLVRPSVKGTNGRSGVPRRYGRVDLLWLRAVVLTLGQGFSLQAIQRHNERNHSCPVEGCAGWRMLIIFDAIGRAETWHRSTLRDNLRGPELLEGSIVRAVASAVA